MNRQKKFRRSALLGWILVLALILAACGPGADPAPPQEEPAAETEAQEEAKEETAEEAPADDSSSMASASGIVNEIVIVEEPSADAAVTRLDTADIDIYATATSDPEVFASIEEAGLNYAQSFGNYSELTFNPAGPVFEGTGKLNPFAVPRVREAMNWLVDRDFIAQELYGGLAQPRYTAITPAFPDYARLVDVARQLELTYAHNPDKANEVITEEMEALGAEMVDGKWQYEGEPVEIIVLIRTEDVRNDVGDYVSNLLEDIGFTVTRDYKAAADASPIWIRGNPGDGQFHIYTGGWITTAVSRDQAGNFDFFYTPRGLSFPLWQAYAPSEEFDTTADRLARRDFTSLDERKELFAEALTLSLKDSTRVWIVSQLGATAFGSEISVAADLAGGVSGTMLWAHTLRKGDESGGSATIAMPSILTEPWNPVAGSNWIFDSMLQRGMTGSGTMPDPFTGLSWPQRIERAEVTIQEGLPVGKTLDWVDLEFVPEITVPEDAWIDWDPVEQRWITVGEMHPDGLTALRKSVVYYPSDLWDVQWHDGSTISMADLMLGQIIGFDRAKEESAIFDESAVPSFEQFQESFRGWRIVSEDPLVVENYTDVFGLDAEANVTTFFPGTSWTILSVGIMADAAGELAFSSDKAEALEIEWANYIAGPSLEILEAKMNEAAAEGSIPYADAMSDYVTDEEIAERWANLQAWYDENEHFWVDQGQYYLEEAFPVEGTVVMQRFEDYPDDADKWTRFSTPQIADVVVDGDSRITVGEEATFDVNVTFNDAPYAVNDIDTVKYLVFDALGELVISAEAEAIEDGLFQVVLTSEQTAELETGANRLEIAVVPMLVSVPTFASVEFVTVP
ncbi:ABC transporter substrate-binding protein [Chloroflexi bacterium TSY]|nr:ABC transporter substrate-binding protein [Chloroflexi bacterium TSY]